MIMLPQPLLPLLLRAPAPAARVELPTPVSPPSPPPAHSAPPPRRSHPFGWWFGRVRSIQEGRVTLEFMQYPHSSVWRRVKAPLRPGEEAVVNGDTTFG